MQFIARQTVRHRFALLGAIALLSAAIPTALFVRDAHRDMQRVGRESAGVLPTRAMLKAIRLAQQHRELSALVVGGNAAMESQRAAKQQEVDQAYQAVSAASA